jgi:hypothetical protein
MKNNSKDGSDSADMLSSKLTALLALNLRLLLQDSDFASKKKRKQGASELVRYFAGFGLDPKDIAQILGTTVQSVRTLLTPSRKGKK